MQWSTPRSVVYHFKYALSTRSIQTEAKLAFNLTRLHVPLMISYLEQSCHKTMWQISVATWCGARNPHDFRGTDETTRGSWCSHLELKYYKTLWTSIKKTACKYKTHIANTTDNALHAHLKRYRVKLQKLAHFEFFSARHFECTTLPWYTSAICRKDIVNKDKAYYNLVFQCILNCLWIFSMQKVWTHILFIF